MPFAFYACIRIDFKNFIAFGDALNWTFRLTCAATDTFIGDFHRHEKFPPD
jgi:hypothetical protein